MTRNRPQPPARLRIGYACVNGSAGCTSSSTLRLASFTRERAEAAARSNLACLARVLEWNAARGIEFFRIGSGVVPLASHPGAAWPWADALRDELRGVGRLARSRGARLCMHPDQFVVPGSPRREAAESSVRELEYHCALLDAMGLPRSAKVQVHLGGAYGDKPAALARFASSVARLPEPVLRRLALENDDRVFTLDDCMAASGATGAPVVLDLFHQSLNGGGDPSEALDRAAGTWRPGDGPQMADYSDQEPGGRRGAHSATIDERAFLATLPALAGRELDLMLEVKDKESSALRAMRLVGEAGRLTARPASPPPSRRRSRR